MPSIYTHQPDLSKRSPTHKPAAPRPGGPQKDFAGASAGMPVFLQRLRLQPKLKENVQNDPLERQADQFAGQVSHPGQLNLLPVARPAGTAPRRRGWLQRLLQNQPATGSPLPSATRQSMERRLGADFGQMRIHTDLASQRLANSLGANAITNGHDIYFNQGRYAPGTPTGESLLAHELAHVVQQDGQAGAAQFDLMQTMPTALGYYEIEMASRAAPRPGMEGHIRFFPDPSGPYSAEIGLVQVVNVTDVGGRTTPASGAPVDWSRVGTGAEAGRNQLMNTGLEGAPPGWFVDVNSAANAPGANIGPNYIEHWLSPAPSNEFGWLRSPTDWRQTSLYDYPWFSFDVDFEFETVAKATDTQAVYGALEWGFGIRSGVVQDEYAHAYDAQSPIFEEALERFRGYYTHEPVVIYFDTNDDWPISGEENKISDFIDYLNRYPDVRLEIDGYADERGSAALNDDLSLRRAENVQSIAISLGVDPSRIDWAVGWGETNRYAAGASAGALRANRRVVITFRRSASTPIVMP
jgi:outer membrane protein OmpA-like peptidoglycan-associated protein